MSDEKALALQRKDALEALVHEVAQDDVKLVNAGKKAQELDSLYHGLWLLQQDDLTLAAHGWTRSELRIAVDAKQPSKDAPLYLTQAHERHKQRHKQAEAQVIADNVVVNNVQINGYSEEELDRAPAIEIGKVG